jgi:hypothetical protein
LELAKARSLEGFFNSRVLAHQAFVILFTSWLSVARTDLSDGLEAWWFLND